MKSSDCGAAGAGRDRASALERADSVGMVLGYQRSDAHLVDYELYQLPGCQGLFRGPPPARDEYIACLGAAQTFGRFVTQPYPKLLADLLGVDPLNLGRGGAGPEYPLRDTALMGYLNRARVVVVQCFSGRSQSNSLFQTLRDNMRGINRTTGLKVTADEFYTWLLEQDPVLARAIVAETRENYIAAMARLLAAIKPPKVLFWFSSRSPEYTEEWQLPLSRLYGDFPQLLNRAMVDRLRYLADAYVECVSCRGLPRSIIDSRGNVNLNRYYPSPEMHVEAATLLHPVCSTLLQGRR